ncbi:MAG TPA: GGDEF domain-containing protein [Gemmatimonadales bacterium]|nr:GGDEF domain-containing protein [Gemmatimonadales bacterium]
MAVARLVVTGLLIITPIAKYLGEPSNDIYALGLTVTAIAFGAAVTVWGLLRRGRYATWMGFVSSGLDVSLVTMALVLFYAAAGPLAAINSKVTFEVYFLALAATALRYDGRISATAGGLAMAQYGAIWAFSLWHDPHLLIRNGDNGYVAADQVTRLILLGSATAIAMLLVSRAQALQHSAATDPLTGIGNRGHFDRRAHAEHERARRYKRHLAIALVDVDHFKQFNDVHGHGVGDTVLITVASLLNRNLRRSDVLARYGGEEFALVLPEATLEAARAKVDLIRRTIEITPLDLPDDREPQRLTISAGIAVYPEDGNTVELLVAVADDRLLAAKRAGRNRVMISEQPDGSP